MKVKCYVCINRRASWSLHPCGLGLVHNLSFKKTQALTVHMSRTNTFVGMIRDHVSAATSETRSQQEQADHVALVVVQCAVEGDCPGHGGCSCGCSEGAVGGWFNWNCRALRHVQPRFNAMVNSALVSLDSTAQQMAECKVAHAENRHTEWWSVNLCVVHIRTDNFVELSRLQLTEGRETPKPLTSTQQHSPAHPEWPQNHKACESTLVTLIRTSFIGTGLIRSWNFFCRDVGHRKRKLGIRNPACWL